MSYERNPHLAATPTDDETYFRCPAGGCAKLTTDNYSRWKADITVLLTASRAIDIVLGTEEPPPNGNSVAAFTATDKYLSRKAGAYGMLVGSCTRATRAYVQGLTEPSEIWTTLRDRLDTNSSTAISSLVRQFNREKHLPTDQSISTYLERLRILREDLMDTYSQISEDAYIDKILTTVPESYYTIRDRVYGNPRDFRNVAYVVNALLEHEKMKLLDDQVRTDAASSLTSGTALFSAPREIRKSRSFNTRRPFAKNKGGDTSRYPTRPLHQRISTGDIRSSGTNGIGKTPIRGNCWHCNKPGHRKDQCRKYQREVGVAAIAHAKTAHAQPIPHSPYPTTNYTQNLEGDQEDEFTVAHALMARGSPIEQVGSGWLIDSGASHNLCPDRYLFTNLTLLSSPIPVYLGDGTSLPGIAKGEIRLRLPSQKILSVQALLVPKLRTSLLSVSVLAELGAVLSFHPGGRCQIGSELVGLTLHNDGIYHFLGTPLPSLLPQNSVPRRVQKQNYRLQNTLPLPQASNMSQPTNYSLVATTPSLHLWHQRLGHLGATAVRKLLGICNESVGGIELDTTSAGKRVDDTEAMETQVSSENEDKDLGESDPLSTCDTCIKAKQQRQITRTPVERTKRPFELIHSDLCGPITPLSMAGARYFIVYIDDFSRYTWVYFLRTKTADEVTSRFQEFQHLVEKQWPDWPIKRFRCDNGKGEYDNGFFRGILRVSGISYEPSPPYTQHKNGVSERMIRTLVMKARSMMIDSRLDDPFWAESINTASFLHARSPSRSIGGKTPYQLLFGNAPDISHLRRFGCVVYKLIPKELRTGKFTPRSVECILLGYVNNTAKIWRLWNPEGGQLGRVVNASDVHFDELRVAGKRLAELPPTDVLKPLLSSEPEPVLHPRHILGIRDEVAPIRHPVPTEEAASTGPISLPKASYIPEPTHAEPSCVPNIITPSLPLRKANGPQGHRPERAVRPRVRVGPSPNTKGGKPEEIGLRRSSRLGGMARANAARVDSIEESDPTSYREALAHQYASKWENAIQEELGSLKMNETWELVAVSQEIKAISNKWVFKTKTNFDGTKRYKARLVIRGYEQADYGETYAPVAKLTTFRMLIAMTAIHGWELDHMDVVTAFLNPPVEGNIYMKPPEGLQVSQSRQQGQRDLQLVCKLKKALYGLKEAPRLWNEHINSFLCSIGFRRSFHDSSLYISWDMMGSGYQAYILLYVDDLLLASPNRNVITHLKDLLTQRYRMTDLGPVQQFLNIRIDRNSTSNLATPNSTTIHLSQERFVLSVLKRFKMEACNGTLTPIDTVRKEKLIRKNTFAESSLPEVNQELEEVCNSEQHREYQSLVGSLMYLMTATRPDLAYTISVLSKFNSSPTVAHLLQAKRVLRYIQQTKSLGLLYTVPNAISDSGDTPLPPLIGFADSDWAGDLSDRKSTSGYLYMIEGTAIAWRARKQTMVALSSTEAEYIGCSDAVKDGLFFQRLLEEFIANPQATHTSPHSSHTSSSPKSVLPSDTTQATRISLTSTSPLVIYMDNQSAMHIASNGRPNKRTKHIDIRHHHVKDMIAGGHILLRYIPTTDMTADIMTKALPRDAHQRHVNGMGLRE